MAMQFPVEKTNELIVSIKKVMNGDPLDVAQELASVLKDAGDNEMLDKVMEQLKTFQDNFNDFTEGLGGFLKELAKIEELDAIIKKLEVGEVKAADTNFKSTEIDVDGIA